MLCHHCMSVTALEGNKHTSPLILISSLSKEAPCIPVYSGIYNFYYRRDCTFCLQCVDPLFHQTLLPESQNSEDLAQNSMASVAKTPLTGKS